MTLEVRKLLEDMREAAADVASFTAGKSIDDYRADKLLRRATERSFEIIGEALTQLRKYDALLADRISDSRKIIAFRNILVHGYGAIDDGKTWDIVQNNLPVLRSELDDLIK
jgi:uncharacterized protein with HEPN domain